MDAFDYKEVMDVFFARITDFVFHNEALAEETEAKSKFFDSFDISEQDKKTLFFDWYVFDGISDIVSKNLIEHMIEVIDIDEEEKTLYRTFLDNIYSIFEIKALRIGKEMIVKDLITDKEYNVKDMNFTSFAKKGQCAIFRIIPFHGYNIISGMGHLFSSDMISIIKLSVGNISNKGEKFDLSPVDICKIFFSKEEKEKLPVIEKFERLCMEAGLDKKYINDIIHQLQHAVKDEKGSSQRIINEVIKKATLKSNSEIKDLYESFANFWNDLIEDNDPNTVKGPLEKAIVSLGMEYVTSNVKPEKYKNIKEANTAADKIINEWLYSPKPELGGKTPVDLILAEREERGDFQKEVGFSVNITDMGPDLDIKTKAEGLFYKGAEFLENKQPEAAREIFEEYIKLNPNNHVVWHNLGIAYVFLMNKKKAKECFEKALELKPDYEMAKKKLKHLKTLTKKDMERVAKEQAPLRVMPKSEAGRFEIYQLKISLKYTKPLIWRRLQIESDLNLYELHCLLNGAMGWDDEHMHEFIIDGRRFGNTDSCSSHDKDIIDEKSVLLNQVFYIEKTKMLYLYDFGDGWEHEVVLEKILQKKDDIKYPLCTGAKRACPPEDCGGIPGYENFLAAISNKDHPGHAHWKEWVGFDPEELPVRVTKI